jgi:citrate synthase
MDRAFAEQFAADWIDSWNSHDLDRVLSHYADDFEMSSPLISQVAGELSGTLRGKAAVGRYWRKALELLPDLHFELISVLAGVTTITLYYKGARGRLVAEVFEFGAELMVTRAFAHYDLSGAAQLFVPPSRGPATRSFSKGLEGVVADETAISFVDSDEGQLYYRGYRIDEIVSKKTFDETAYMLLEGQFPSKSELLKFRAQLADAYELPPRASAVIDALPRGAHPMEAIQAVLAVIGSTRPEQLQVHRVAGPDGHKRSVVKDPSAHRNELVDVLARIPTIIARFCRHQGGQEQIPPRKDLSLLTNFLYMLHGREPSAAEVRVFEVCQILQLEHGLNASTFTARVVASTLAPIHTCLSSAVGALFGRLHGGADEATFRMAHDEIRTLDRAEGYVRDTLKAGRLVMGLGHRVYRTVDPRALILKRVAADVSAAKGGDKETLFRILVKVEDTATRMFADQGKELYANVEFFKGAVFNALDIQSMYYTSMFVMARAFGWGAHILELWRDNRLYRPEANFVGVVNRVVPGPEIEPQSAA